MGFNRAPKEDWKKVRRKILTTALLCLWIAACAPRAEVKSSPVEDTLYFGLSTSQGPVTPAQWDDFLSREVTPRFPDGLTVWDAKGEWKDSKGVIGKEPSKVLLLVHPDNAAEDKAIQAIIDSYKEKFNQESVLRVRSRPEIRF